ncbi:FtsQ-type POTRA domain-containing protein [Treponema sp.]|uniref:cell division protein FtsQ/DivIB n=1 Tax=Treponema sp. TaxID=166 RepID=UPI001B2AB0B1|nr:FtsQ-type POTRA domain-containing protein [Treponema sp.]MBE6353506.1 FtsQ-type POTRA domain-containing protein [Treponema sp.]MBO6176545.1 FtsQ-type POTRA domain-containing protein [Treponema sp.]
MSDVAFLDFEDFEYEPYSPAGHGASETSDKKIFILKIFSFSIIVVLSLYFILANLIFPCFEVPQITFTGASAGTVEKMKGLLNAPSEYNYFNFDTARVARALNSLSCIESVEVIKHFPHTVEIHVAERKPLAKTLVRLNGKTIPVAIDRSGVLFISDSINSIISDTSYPLLSGLPVEQFYDGMKIPTDYKELMSDIATMSSLPQNYFVGISEIQVIPKEYGGYELAVYPIHTKARVLTDRALNEDSLKYMMITLEVIKRIAPEDVFEIDIRYGEVSYKKRAD